MLTWLRQRHAHGATEGLEGDHVRYTCPWALPRSATHGQLGGALFDEIAYFVRVVRHGEAPTLISEAETLAGLRAARALQESAEQGQEVRVPG
jgi:predicted dehydrogenase